MTPFSGLLVSFLIMVIWFTDMLCFLFYIEAVLPKMQVLLRILDEQLQAIFDDHKILKEVFMPEAQSKWYHWLRLPSAEEVATRVYTGLLSAEYKALDPKSIPAEDKKLYEDIRGDIDKWTLKGNGSIPDWPDLCSVEARLLHLLPQDALRIKLILVRERLRELTGPQGYAAYEKLIPPDTDLKGESLRECLKQLVSELHFQYQIRSQREKLRVRLTRFAGEGLGIAAVLALLSVLISWLTNQMYGRFHQY
jgi:hypothetical protein